MRSSIDVWISLFVVLLIAIGEVCGEWRVGGVVAEHCQLWQALWKWQIDYDTQQENVRKLALQSSGVDGLPVEGSTRLDP